MVIPGMMFPISGNLMENKDSEPWKNYFFRNGMTVAIAEQGIGTRAQVPIERQRNSR